MAKCGEIEGRLAELLERRPRRTSLGLDEQLLDFGIGVELRDFFLEDQVGPHAARGKVPDPGFIFGAVGVAIEVPHAGPLGILEELDEEERALGIVAAESQILVVAPNLLAVEIDVEQLPGLERLGDGVREIEARHPFVRDFRIDAHHVRMIQRINEREHVPGGRQEDVAARLVRFGLECQAQVVAL